MDEVQCAPSSGLLLVALQWDFAQLVTTFSLELFLHLASRPCMSDFPPSLLHGWLLLGFTSLMSECDKAVEHLFLAPVLSVVLSWLMASSTMWMYGVKNLPYGNPVRGAAPAVS